MSDVSMPITAGVRELVERCVRCAGDERVDEYAAMIRDQCDAVDSVHRSLEAEYEDLAGFVGRLKAAAASQEALSVFGVDYLPAPRTLLEVTDDGDTVIRAPVTAELRAAAVRETNTIKSFDGVTQWLPGKIEFGPDFDWLCDEIDMRYNALWHEAARLRNEAAALVVPEAEPGSEAGNDERSESYTFDLTEYKVVRLEASEHFVETIPEHLVKCMAWLLTNISTDTDIVRFRNEVDA